MNSTSKYDCPKCQKKIGWSQRNRFFKVGIIPVAAPCPHCGTSLTLPPEPWKKMWIGIFVFAVPGWIELLTSGVIQYSYLVMPATLWLVWSNQRHIKLMRVPPENEREDAEVKRTQSGKQRKKRKR